jgi:diadenosine tetraphosphate (Ap4A) HIT family hydrolase
MSHASSVAILAGKAPASFIYRDDSDVPIMDLYPVNPRALLIIPTCACRILSKVDPTVAAHIMELAQRLGRAVSASSLGCDGFNLFLANGGAAGQDIFHAHLHILKPRFHGTVSVFASQGIIPERQNASC